MTVCSLWVVGDCDPSAVKSNPIASVRLMVISLEPVIDWREEGHYR